MKRLRISLQVRMPIRFEYSWFTLNCQAGVLHSHIRRSLVVIWQGTLMQKHRSEAETKEYIQSLLKKHPGIKTIHITGYGDIPVVTVTRVREILKEHYPEVRMEEEDANLMFRMLDRDYPKLRAKEKTLTLAVQYLEWIEDGSDPSYRNFLRKLKGKDRPDG